MNKICSVTIAATVQDAVETIQEESSENNEQVSLKRNQC